MNILDAFYLVGNEDTEVLKSLFNKHKDFFSKLVDEENKRNPTFKDLQYAFTDLNGKKYYKFPEGMALPLERIGMLLDLNMYIQTGMDGKQWDGAVDNIDLAIYEGISDPAVAGKIGAQTKIIKEMRGKVFHTELLYQMAAVQLVREDESIVAYNNDIQLEKVAQFKKEVEKSGSFFFFHMTDLKTLRKYLELSQAEWTSLWQESETNQEELRKISLFLKQSVKKFSKEKQSSEST